MHFVPTLLLGAALALLLSCSSQQFEPQSATAKPMVDAQTLADALELAGHIEGGFFRRTYQSDHRSMLHTNAGERYLMTSIYYMLTRQSPVGHFHLNQSDIMHYYHLGDAIRYTLIYPDGTLKTVTMGSDVAQGENLQLHVPGGVWKASELLPGPAGYSLISEAVSPGFDYADMRIGTREELTALLPEHEAVFRRLAHETLPD